MAKIQSWSVGGSLLIPKPPLSFILELADRRVLYMFVVFVNGNIEDMTVPMKYDEKFNLTSFFAIYRVRQ